MNKTTPSQSDYCRLKVAHHLRENLVLSLVAVSREMRVQFSHRPPSLARELDGRVLV
jgi:hypothetical protein